MIRKILSGLAQGTLFLALFAAGSFVRPFHLSWALARTSPEATRFFVPDGLLLAVTALLLLLGVAAARQRLGVSGPVTTIAFLLAVLLGFAAKLGFVTREF